MLIARRQNRVKVGAKRPRWQLLHGGHNSPSNGLDAIGVLNRKPGVAKEPRQVVNDQPFPPAGLDAFDGNLQLSPSIGAAGLIQIGRQHMNLPAHPRRVILNCRALILGATKALPASPTYARHTAISDPHRAYNTCVEASRASRTRRGISLSNQKPDALRRWAFVRGAAAPPFRVLGGVV